MRELPTFAECVNADIEGNDTLLANPRVVEKDVKVVANKTARMVLFRLSVDLQRAMYVTIMTGVGYLLLVAISPLSLPGI